MLVSVSHTTRIYCCKDRNARAESDLGPLSSLQLVEESFVLTACPHVHMINMRILALSPLQRPRTCDQWIQSPPQNKENNNFAYVVMIAQDCSLVVGSLEMLESTAEAGNGILCDAGAATHVSLLYSSNRLI